MSGAALRVEPATAEQLRALMEGEEEFRRRYGLTPAEGYLSFDGVLEYSLGQLTEEGADPAWSTHLFLLGAELVGIGGFKGPPSEGTVEIGYEVAPAHRGRGVATEAARRLVAEAQARGVATVIAHTLAEENASTRVLEHLGFKRVAEMDDTDIGPVWRWEKRVGSAERDGTLGLAAVPGGPD